MALNNRAEEGITPEGLDAARAALNKPAIKYYDTETENFVSVPASTETAIRLLTPKAKDQLKQFLQAYIKSASSAKSSDYNDLLKEVIDQQETIGSSVESELKDIVSPLQGLRATIAEVDDAVSYSIAAGLQPIMVALTKARARLGEMEAYETYHRIFSSYIEQQHKKNTVEALERELNSWVAVLTAFP